MSGRISSSSSDFSVYLRRLGRLQDVADFVSRLPLIFFNQVTSVGTIVPEKKTLSYKPNFRIDATNTRDVLFCQGHLVNFDLHPNKPLFHDSIRTEVEYAAENPHRERTIQILEEALRKPAPYIDRNGKAIPFESTFSISTLDFGKSMLGISTELVKPIKSGTPIEEYWYSFWTGVGRPLYASIQRAYD